MVAREERKSKSGIERGKGREEKIGGWGGVKEREQGSERKRKLESVEERKGEGRREREGEKREMNR